MGIYEKLEDLEDAADCKTLLRRIERTVTNQDTPIVNFQERYRTLHSLTPF